MADIYAEQLERLLLLSPEDVEEARRSGAQAVFELLREPVIVWGCGPLGERVARALGALNIPIAAFVDRDEGRWGTRFFGVGVSGPDDIAAGAFPKSVVVIAVYTAEPLRILLRGWGRTFLTFPILASAFPDVMLPYCALDRATRVFDDADEIRAGLTVWSDNWSRNEYVAQLSWRLSLDDDLLPAHLPARETYFPTRWLSLSDDEHFVDCGAYDGDTVREFLQLTSRKFRHVTAFEADATNFSRLVTWVSGLSADEQGRITAINEAVGAAPGTVFFNADATVASRVGEGVPIRVTTLSESASGNSPVTYVKMDIEGFEPQAIVGAERIIRQDRPVLAICVYHAFDHLWSIPNQLKAVVPDYDFFLGRHSDECWESVCYGIPRKSLYANYESRAEIS